MAETKNAPEVEKDPAGLLDGIYEDFKKTLDKYTSERQKADPSKDLVVLKDKEKSPFEAPRSVWAQNFELGQYLADKKPEIKAKEAVYFMTGSVDRTVFDKKIKRESVVAYKYNDKEGKEHKVGWYEDAAATAQNFVAFSDRIDADGFSTMEDGEKKERMTAIMTAIAGMTEFTDAAWAKMIEENKFTEEEIYGPEGAYNLLLSFNRAVGNIDLTEDPTIAIGKDVDGNDVEVPVIYKIKLKIAKKSGNRKKDRFGKVVEIKVKKVEEPKKPAEPAKEEPKVEPKVEPVKPKSEPAKPAEKPKTEPAKPQENPQPKPVETVKPKPAEVAENFADRLAALKAAGFELWNTPKKVGDKVYAAYKDKRVTLTFQANGRYEVEMLTLPDGRTEATKGQGLVATDTAKMIDPLKSDKSKVMLEDLKHSRGGVNVSAVDLEGEKAQQVTIRGYKHEMKNGEIKAPVDLKFNVVLDTTTGLYKPEYLDGRKLPPNKDARALVKVISPLLWIDSQKAE